MDATLLTGALLTLIALEVAANALAEWLQARHLRSPEGSRVVEILGQDGTRAVAKRHVDTALITAARGLLTVVGLALLIGTGALADVYRASASFFGARYAGPTIFLSGFAVLATLLNTPIAWWDRASKRRAPGVHEGTSETFIRDQLGAIVVSLILTASVVPLVLWLHYSLGVDAWIPLLGVPTLFVAGIFAIRKAGLSLFNEPSLLPEGPTKQHIREQLGEYGYELRKVVVLDGSNNKLEPGVEIDGLRRMKTVRLGESLFERLDAQEIRALVASEVEWGGIPALMLRAIVRFTLILGPMLVLVAILIDSRLLSRALGSDEVALGLNLLAIALLPIPTDLLDSAVSRALSVRHATRMARTEHGPILARILREDPGVTATMHSAHPLFKLVNMDMAPTLERAAILDGESPTV